MAEMQEITEYLDKSTIGRGDPRTPSRVGCGRNAHRKPLRCPAPAPPSALYCADQPGQPSAPLGELTRIITELDRLGLQVNATGDDN